MSNFPEQSKSDMPISRYAPFNPFPNNAGLVDRTWPSKTLKSAPKWCSVDLRDGNQALIDPMDANRKLAMFKLLVKMGYGGSRRDAGQRIGQSGDGGIDGIIKEDRLGLDTIFIQAKRWQGSVGRPEIQKFVGALTGQRARKGVFITTSTYSAEARDYAGQIDPKVVLIDGQQLAGLMIDFDIGVAHAATYTIKRIDSDYFEEG
jgi:hypothetical protein